MDPSTPPQAAAAAAAARLARQASLSVNPEAAAQTFAEAGSTMQSPHTPPAQRQQASDWLVELQQGDAAWGVLRLVLGDATGQQSDATKWLAATVLSNKLREAGDAIHSAGGLEQLQSDVLGYLAAAAQSNPARGPTLTVAACRVAACGGSAGVVALIQDATARLGESEAMLAVLAALPEEWAAKVGIQSAGQTDELVPLHGAVLQAVGSALSAMGGAGAEQYPLVRTAVKVLVNWLQNGGLSIETLHSGGMIVGLAPALLVPELFSAVAELFTGMCEGCGEATDETSSAMVVQVLAQLAQLEAPIAAAAAQADSDDLAQSSLEVANLLAALAKREVRSAPPLLQDTPEAASVLRTGLVCAGHPSPSVRESALEFWSQLAAQLSDNPRPAITPLFAQLLQLMLQSCAYPADFPTDGTDKWQESSEVDEDAWERHRRAAAGLLSDCCGVVRTHAIHRCLKFCFLFLTDCLCS